MDDLEEIKQRIDVVSFINDYTPLKKVGRNFKALCPFHSEKTPSFIVSPERQIWHCFGGCSEGGDIFTFLMKIENLEFPEALEILAKKAGVVLSRQYKVTENQKLKEEILSANRYASQFFHYLLTRHSVGEKARQYLKQRQIGGRIIETFSLGYASISWNGLTKFLRKRGFSDFILTKAGLAVSGRGGKIYDRFRGRLIFTLRDHRENVIGFSGRKLPQYEDTDKEAKYINTQETPVYIKGNVLYGLDVTYKAIRKAGEAIIVEGEFDLLSSFQSGVTNVVAIKGTALTANQASLLKRFTETIILALDSDIAGDAAVRRGIEIAENAGFHIKVTPIPQGKDPDECIKGSPLSWKKTVGKSISIYEFLLQSALKRYDKTDAYGKKKIADELLPFYEKITNTIIQSHYISLLAKSINTAEERLIETMAKIKKGKPVDFVPEAVSKEDKRRDILLEEYFLSLLLQTPAISLIKDTLTKEEIKEIINSIENPGIKKIIDLFYLWTQNVKDKSPEIASFIKTLLEELVPLADRAYLYQLGEIIEDKTYFQKELHQTKNNLLDLSIRRRIKDFSTKIKEINDETRLKKLNEELNKLKSRLKELAKKRGR